MSDPTATAAPRAAIATLNVTVQQIESDLRRGRTIEQVAEDWSEPRVNVFAVKRAMEASGERFQAPPRTPGAPVPGARPATSASPMGTAPAALSVDALVAAAARSTSKRTQALAVRLADLAKVVRDRLRDEREAAEKAEATKAQRQAARAEVARLETQLRAARARAGLRGGVARGNTAPRTPAQIDAMAHAREAARGEFPCSKGCGKVSTTKAGQLSHERHCTAVPS